MPCSACSPAARRDWAGSAQRSGPGLRDGPDCKILPKSELRVLAQVRERPLCLLARPSLLVDLEQRATLGGVGPRLRHRDLLASALQARRE